jgi:hypothetical protein
MTKSALILILSPTSLAWAVVCPPNPGLAKNLDLIHKAHFVGGENRVSLKPFARSLGLSEEETKKMFAATGQMKCGNQYTTVQLSGKNNLVTTAAHAIRHEDSCKKLNLPCEIQFPYSSNPSKIYRMKPNSWKDGGCEVGQSKTDWAVFELDSPVPNVTPYEIPEDGHFVRTPKTVLKVAARAHNFTPTEGEEKIKHNYNFELCRIRDRDLFSNVNLQTDCDSGKQTSGAGELILQNQKYYLNSIIVSESRLRPSGTDYSRTEHFNISVAVEGEFLKELRSRL